MDSPSIFPHKQEQDFSKNFSTAGKKGLQEYHNQKIRNIEKAIVIATVRMGARTSSEGHSTQPLEVMTPVLEQTPQTGPDPLFKHILLPLQLPGSTTTKQLSDA